MVIEKETNVIFKNYTRWELSFKCSNKKERKESTSWYELNVTFLLNIYKHKAKIKHG